MTMNTYEIRNSGLAAFLLYVLGDGSHISTKQKGTGFLFTFDDPECKCRDLQTAFFSDESVQIANARELLECARNVSYTVGQTKQFGEWTKPE